MSETRKGEVREYARVRREITKGSRFSLKFDFSTTVVL